MRGSGKAQDLGCTGVSGAQDRKRGSVLKWGLAVTVEDRFVQAAWAEQEQRVEGRALETFRVFVHSLHKSATSAFCVAGSVLWGVQQ